VRDPQHPRLQALHHSNCEPHALATVPTDESNTFSNKAFEVIVARKLLAPLQTPLNGNESLTCSGCHKKTCTNNCSTGPDIYGDHALSCTRSLGGMRSQWHDGLRNAMEKIARFARCSVSREVCGYIPASNMRADLVMSDLRNRKTTLFDVRTVDPTKSSQRVCLESAIVPGFAAKFEEDAKTRKWLPHCQQLGLAFVPLAFEAGGRMGVHAQRFLDSLVQRAGGSSRSDQARFRCWASQQLACANMQGVAKLILSVRGHIRQRHDNRDSRVRSVSDIYLPPLPVAPVGCHRERD
jgi:hypothetical protein